jgi:glyoxylase-like metal-dependent hydrolase (beta-lactamase superfamily II)
MDWEKLEAAIIDPQKDLSGPLNFLKQNKFTLTGTFLTHTHPDHTAGVPELIRTFPSVPIFVHGDDLFRFDPHTLETAAIRPVKDGETVPVGKLRMKAVHTPGHSKGGCCFLLEVSSDSLYLFTGDTVFIRDCGRTDLETGSTMSMFQSLQRLKTLPHQAILLPGHHYQLECASTLATELVENPAFRCQSVADLEALP